MNGLAFDPEHTPLYCEGYRRLQVVAIYGDAMAKHFALDVAQRNPVWTAALPVTGYLVRQLAEVGRYDLKMLLTHTHSHDQNQHDRQRNTSDHCRVPFRSGLFQVTAPRHITLRSVSCIPPS